MYALIEISLDATSCLCSRIVALVTGVGLGSSQSHVLVRR